MRDLVIGQYQIIIDGGRARGVAVTLQPCRQRRAQATQSHWPGWVKGRRNGRCGQVPERMAPERMAPERMAPERIAPPPLGTRPTPTALFPISSGGGPQGLRDLRVSGILSSL